MQRTHSINSITHDRYSYQGQEMDDEVKGDGNSVNYKYRMHDPRLGRFFAIDPLADNYPFYSPYAFSGNRVIDAIELEGLEPNNVHYYNMVKQNDGNYKPVYHHSNSILVIKSVKAIFRSSISKKEAKALKGNHGEQTTTTNVYTYWNSDGTINRQVVVSNGLDSDITNQKVNVIRQEVTEVETVDISPEPEGMIETTTHKEITINSSEEVFVDQSKKDTEEVTGHKEKRLDTYTKEITIDKTTYGDPSGYKINKTGQNIINYISEKTGEKILAPLVKRILKSL
ncbi:MAG: hypothetical protein KA264_11585 [Crocinitomicaceae bacterium]|jgi:RHS repeat-associated protein|nr:hypothetical protein [Crocinitomicaceae bacterium]